MTPRLVASLVLFGGLYTAQLVSQTNLDTTKWTAVNGGWINEPNGDLICNLPSQCFGLWWTAYPYRDKCPGRRHLSRWRGLRSSDALLYWRNHLHNFI